MLVWLSALTARAAESQPPAVPAGVEVSPLAREWRMPPHGRIRWGLWGVWGLYSECSRDWRDAVCFWNLEGDLLHHMAPIADNIETFDSCRGFDCRARVAIGTDTGAIWLWSPAERDGVERWRTDGPVDEVLWSPNGTWLATQSGRAVQIWEGGADAPRFTVPNPEDRSIQFIHWTGKDELTVRYLLEEPQSWDVVKGTLLQAEEKATRGSLREDPYDKELRWRPWSRSGELVATADPTSGWVRLWDASTHAEIQRLPFPNVRDVALGPRGTLAVSDGSQTWLVEDPVQQGSVRWAHLSPAAVTDLSFSADGAWLARSGGHAQVLDLGSGRVIWSLDPAPEHPTVGRVAFSPVEPRLALQAGSRIAFWSTSEVDLEACWLGGDRALVWNVQGDLVAGDGYHTVRTCSAASTRSGREFPDLNVAVTAVAMNAEGQIASGAEDGVVRIWDPGGREVARFDRGKGEVIEVSFDPTGKQLAIGSLESPVRIWEPATGAVAARLEAPGPVTDVAWGSAGWIATTSEDGTIHLWDPAIPTPLAGYTTTHPLTSVAWSVDSTAVAVGGENGSVAVLDPVTLEPVRTWPGAHAVTALAVSPDGARLAVGHDDGLIALWDLAVGHEVARAAGHTRAVHQLVWSNGHLLSSGPDGTARVWSGDGAEVRRIEAAGAGRAAVWSADGRWAATGERDGSITLWDGATGASLQSWPVRGEVSSLLFSPDGARLYAGTSNGMSGWSTGTARLLWEEQDTEGTLRLWSNTLGTRIVALSGTKRPSLEMRVAASGRYDDALLGQVASPDGTGGFLTASDRIWSERQEVLAYGSVGDTFTSLVAGQDLLFAGTSDGRVRSWTVRTGTPVAIYHSVADGSWYSRRADGRLVWAQSAPNLEEWRPDRGFQPVRPPKRDTSLSLTGGEVALGDGAPAATVTLRIENDGIGPAYEVRVEPAEALPPGFTIVPMSWASRLEPGEFLEVPVRVRWVRPAGDPQAPEQVVPLVARSAWADSAPAPLLVHTATALPVLTEVTRRAVGASASVEVVLGNRGVAYDHPVRVSLEFLGTFGAVLATSSTKAIDTLPAGDGVVRLTYAVPADRVADGRLRVRARLVGARAPTHRWVTAPVGTGGPSPAAIAGGAGLGVLATGIAGWA